MRAGARNVAANPANPDTLRALHVLQAAASPSISPEVNAKSKIIL